MRLSFEEFVDTHSRRLLGSAHLLTGDQHAAQDLVQDALERVFVHWARVEDPLAHTRTVMARRVTDGWRAAARRPRQQPLEPEDHGVPVPDGAEHRAERAHVADLLSALPARQRAVVVLRFYEDLSEAQIAEALDCAPGTVKSQAAKALRTLRRLVGQGTDAPADHPTPGRNP